MAQGMSNAGIAGRAGRHRTGRREAHRQRVHEVRPAAVGDRQPPRARRAAVPAVLSERRPTRRPDRLCGERTRPRSSTCVADPEAEVVIEPPGAGDGYWAGGPSGRVARRQLLPRLPAAPAGYRGARLRQRRRPLDRRGRLRHRGDGDERPVRVRVARTAGARPARRRRLAALRLVLDARTRSTGGSRRSRPAISRTSRAVGAPSCCPATLPRRGRTRRAPQRRRLADVGVPAPARRRGRRGRPDDRGLSHQRRRPGLEPRAGTALAPTPDTWDARGARITSVVRDGTELVGVLRRARERGPRTGSSARARRSADRPARSARPPGPRRSGRTVRYVSLAEPLTGATRLYWEASRPDGANELRTAYVPRPLSPSQS